MALKVKAVERLLKFDKESAGKYRYVLKPDLYTSLSQAKVIKEAALRSGVSQGVMKACWDAAGEVIKAWATEGHAVALPGLGSMRFGLRSKPVEKVEDDAIGNKVKVIVSATDALVTRLQQVLMLVDHSQTESTIHTNYKLGERHQCRQRVILSYNC